MTDPVEPYLSDDYRWSVHDVIPQPWSFDAEAQAKIDAWSQGDIVCDIPAVWLTTDDAETSTTDGTTAGAVVPISTGQNAADWVVVSQTCDVRTTGPGSHHPFVQVAPLIHKSDLNANTAGNAASWRIGYLVPLDHERIASKEPVWFADLRVQVPLSKGVLAGRTPTRAFLTEPDLLRFGQMVQGKFGRPALASVLSEDLASAIERFAKARKQTNAIAHTEHVRVIIDDGTRLIPGRVSLLVVTKVALTDDEQKVWRGTLEPSMKAVLTAAGIQYKVTLIQQPSEINAQLYRASVALNVATFGDTNWL